MAKKTVSDLLKEMPAIDRKDLFAYFEKQGKGKVSAKTTLTDEEFDRGKEQFGRTPRPQLTLGEDRVVTQSVTDESGATTHETVTERRTTNTLIRRRKV